MLEKVVCAEPPAVVAVILVIVKSLSSSSPSTSVSSINKSYSFPLALLKVEP